MFTWSHETSMDVDLPLQQVWNFYLDPSNWPKWEDRLESCVLKGDLRVGAKIRAKVKDKPVQLLFFVTEIKPYHECKFLTKTPLATQESLCTFEELSPEKTRITLKICIISLLTPFMRAIFRKHTEKTYSKCFNVLAEIAIQSRKACSLINFDRS
jgi:polyketide cyclase/dehydrase/lipid transport protein